MTPQLKDFCEQLETAIQQAYESAVTIEEAEKLAAKFLHGQLQVSQALRGQDLDARMKKAGLKAVKAAVYMNEVGKSEKKPTEAMLTSLIDSNELVNGAQSDLDTAEVDRDYLKACYDIFNNAHIHFRGVSKGAFGG